VIKGVWFRRLWAGMRHFLDCLATGAQPVTNGRGNLHVLQAVFAAFESAGDRVVRVDAIALDGDYDLNPAPVVG